MIHATFSRKNLRTHKWDYSGDESEDTNKRKAALQKLAAVWLTFRNQ